LSFSECSQSQGNLARRKEVLCVIKKIFNSFHLWLIGVEGEGGGVSYDLSRANRIKKKKKKEG